MKTFVVLAWLALPLIACGGEKAATVAEAKAKAASVTLVLEGTTCEGCATHIEETLAKVDGITEAKASHEQARAWVTFDPAKLKAADIIQAIEKAGYKARTATEAEATPPPKAP